MYCECFVGFFGVDCTEGEYNMGWETCPGRLPGLNVSLQFGGGGQCTHSTIAAAALSCVCANASAVSRVWLQITCNGRGYPQPQGGTCTCQCNHPFKAPACTVSGDNTPIFGLPCALCSSVSHSRVIECSTKLGFRVRLLTLQTTELHRAEQMILGMTMVRVATAGSVSRGY